MLGLRSQFGAQLVVSLVVTAVALVAGTLAGVRARRAQTAWVVPTARILAGGAALVVLLGTIVPRVRIPAYERHGDLVLQPGRAGLGDWQVLLSDPTSLAAVLLISNVVIFVPVSFFGVLGWPGRGLTVNVVCLVLSALVEATQLLFLGRVAATDDVLLNMAALLAGDGRRPARSSVGGTLRGARLPGWRADRLVATHS